MIFSLVAMFILAVALPFSLFNAPEWNTDALLSYGVLVVCSIKLGQLILKAEFRPLAFTFWIFVYTWGALAPLLQTAVNKFPWPIFHSPESQTTAIWLTLLTVICYEAGYARQAQFRNVASWNFELDPRKIFYLGIIVAIWTVVHIFWLGGPEALMVSRGVVKRAIRATADTRAEGFIRLASLRAPVFIYVLILAYLTFGARHLKDRLPRQIRTPLIWLLVGLIPLHFIANYPNAQTRAWLGALLIAPVLLLMPRQRHHIFGFIVGFILATIVAFPQMDSNRSKDAEAGVLDTIRVNENIARNTRREILGSADFDVFQQFCNGVEYLKENPIMWGRNIGGAALFWVPRKWWPEKPIGTGYVVAMYFQNPSSNLSAPLWMEFYMAFGGIGLVVLMFLYGRATAFVDNRFHNAADSLGSVHNAFPVLACFWAGYQLMILRGSLLFSITIASVPVLVILLSVSRRQLSALPSNLAMPER